MPPRDRCRTPAVGWAWTKPTSMCARFHREEVDLPFRPPITSCASPSRPAHGQDGAAAARTSRAAADAAPTRNPLRWSGHRLTVFVAKPLEYPLRGVLLLGWTALIVLQNLIDDPDERVQLRPYWWAATPLPGRSREGRQLRDLLRIQPEPTPCLATPQASVRTEWRTCL